MAGGAVLLVRSSSYGGPVSLKESYFPVALVTTLFFLWGFAYGMLDVLNKHFQNTLGVSKVQSTALQTAYFGAYFVSPMLFSTYVLKRWGYKYTFILGLTIYGIGAICFWPCAKYRSFAGFCACTFVVGLGLGTLEVSANPYVTVCGPMEYSAIRLNLSQAFNGIGKIVGPLIASDTFFRSGNGRDLSSIQWVYLAITIFVWALAVVFYFSRIPEISDEDMQYQQEVTPGALRHDQKPITQQYRLFLAIWAQFMYVGAEVSIATFFINYADEVAGYTDSKSAKLLSAAQGIFTFGRFFSTACMKWIEARYMLAAFVSILVIMSAMASTINGTAGITLYMLLFFFESLCFPTIFSLGLVGLGRHTKRGAGLIIQSIIGGACFPPAMGALATSKSTHISVVVPMTGYVLCSVFAYYLPFDERYRQNRDDSVPVKKEEIESEVAVDADVSAEARKDAESSS